MEMCNRRRRIAVILTDVSQEYAHETLRGIEEEARTQEMDVYVFNADVGTDSTVKHNIGEYNIYKLAEYSLFDGIIFFANLISDQDVYNSVIESIRASGVTAVSIDAEIEGFYFIGVENYQPMKNMVEHLIVHHGYTRINYISGRDFNSDSRERLEAYCDALQEHGIPVEEERIFRGSFGTAHGREVAMKMLESPQSIPEAIVCATDSIAIGVKSVFDKHGIKIPQQVALTGFDNIFESRNAIASLTTVTRNQNQVGHEAVKRIAGRLKGEEVPSKKRFSATSIFRESCGCCNEEQDDIATVRRKYLDTAEHYERYLYDSVMLMEDLNDSKNLRDFLERLKNYVERLNCDTFFLCLDKELVEDLQYADTGKKRKKFHDNYQTEGFPNTMSVVLAYDRGEFISVDEFASPLMLPEFSGMDEGNHTFIFAPVHFRDRCLGYVVVENSRFASGSPVFRTWLINLSNALENLRKQAHLKSMLERVDRMYVMDSLTGLYNRFGFTRYTGESFSRCVGMGESFMILFADMDGLKEINDQYGHDNGDMAISVVAHVLRMACRKGEICARIGGDEFVVYAEGYTETDAATYCKRVEGLLEEANEELDKPYQVGISYGYEIAYPDAGELLDKYVDMADDKMYANKKRKKLELSHKSEKIQIN